MSTTAAMQAPHQRPLHSPSGGQPRTAAPKKPVPEFVPANRRLGEKLGDLIWLIKTTVAAAPAETALFAAIAVAVGLSAPLEMWATRNLVDSLASWIGGAADAGVGAVESPGVAGRPEASAGAGAVAVWGWFAVVAVVLVVERVLYALEPVWRIKAKDVAGHNLEAAAMRKASRLELIAFENEALYNQLDRVMQGSFDRGPEAVEIAVRIAGTLPAVAGFAVVLAVYAPALLVISLAVVFLSHVTLWRTGESAWRLLHQQTRTRRLADYFASALASRAHVKEIRLYGLAQHFLSRWSSLYWETRNEQRRLALRQAVYERLMIVASLVVGLAGFGWVIAGGMTAATPGEYAILFRAFFGMWSIAEMSFLVKRLSTAAGYAGEFRAFMGLAEEGEESATSPGASLTPAPSSKPAHSPAPPPHLLHEIRFEDVWFTYPGSERPVLAGVSFCVRAGEKVALVGENGAGKSTLMKLLLGFYRPDHGRVTLDGVDIAEIDPRRLRRIFSAIFQHAVQYNLRLIDNVVLSDPARPVDRVRVDEAVRRSGLSEIVERHALDLETVVGPDVGGTELSGGQWQRVALARAFYRQAEILILDEPTAALDPNAELEVFQRFLELAEDRTAILISHRMGMARLADRIVVLRDGKVVEDGTHDELIALRGEYAALFEAQARWYR